MSVVENPMTERAAPNVQQQFAIGSAVVAVALLAGLGVIFGALPLYWSQGWESAFAENKDFRENMFLSDALLVLLELVVIGALAFGAYRLLQQYTQPGLRAGAVIGATYVVASLWFASWLGTGPLSTNFADNPTVGWAVMAVLLAAGYVYLMVPGWLGLMESLETQGWFHANPYKGNQGVRVRRGTIVGILAVGVSGIITMVSHRLFDYEHPHPTLQGATIPNDWYLTVPFTNPSVVAYLMFKVHLIMPIILGILLVWTAWRIVNMPTFADFLIATEAEMNKVSWTNRKRLVQDTVVVLVTVFLFTMFLFVVDILWIRILSAPYIEVLLYDPREKQQQQQETAKW